MGQISSNSALGTAAVEQQYRAEQAKGGQNKSRVNGRTIGDPVLSEKAQKYYDQLRKKYGDMDFILVSPEMKEEAERNKGMYGSSKEFVVLIDSDKIEKMATDEAYRKKYEGILDNARSQMGSILEQLGSKAGSISSLGMTFDDHGNASFFAVVDKSLATQRERIEEKRAESRKERKEAEKEKWEERLYGRGDDLRDGRVTVEGSSVDELMKRINEALSQAWTDSVMTDQEKNVGGGFDASI